MIPNSAKVSLKVVATETESITASTATPVRRFCSVREIPSFSKSLQCFWAQWQNGQFKRQLEHRLHCFHVLDGKRLRADVPVGRWRHDKLIHKGKGPDADALVLNIVIPR